MAKHIVIKTCDGCPHFGHRGAFGNPSHVPVCSYENKNLPYESRIARSGASVQAFPTNVIPEWCPLEDLDHG